LEDDAGEAVCTFHLLNREADGYFSGSIQASAGQRYRFRVDQDKLYPDPASRYQPDGPHASSVIIDPSKFAWSDSQWSGRKLNGQIIYEIHVGTFPPEGKWAAAAGQLAELARIGITAVEMMPIADFPGKFGWGYDGVDFFAPAHQYGTPDDLRGFIN